MLKVSSKTNVTELPKKKICDQIRRNQQNAASSCYSNHAPNILRKQMDSSHVNKVGSAVAWWLVRSTPERAVWVRALAGDIVLCSWARHLTLTVPLSTQVYKWVPANCWGNLTKLRGSDLRWTSIPSRGSRNTSRLHATETGISSGSNEPALAPRLHFTCKQAKTC